MENGLEQCVFGRLLWSSFSLGRIHLKKVFGTVGVDFLTD